MRSRSVIAAVVVTILFGATAVGAYVQSARLRSEAGLLLARGEAAGKEYAATLDGALAERQLWTLDLRREALEKAHFWHRIQLLAILAGVVSALCTYILYLIHRIRQQLPETEGEPSPSRL